MYSLYRYEKSNQNLPVRIMLNHADAKTDFVCPCLRLPDGKIISDSSEIGKYLAIEHGYLGDNAKQNKICDNIVKEARNLFILIEEASANTDNKNLEVKIKLFTSEIEKKILQNGGKFIFGPR
ncbi:hypothetical protein HZS_428, partial [Henneguya salminicola]